MSRGPRRPATVPEPPPGYFYLTQWRRTRDVGARESRERWKAALAVLGIRAVIVEIDGYAALAREGEEALSGSGWRERIRAGAKNCG